MSKRDRLLQGLRDSGIDDPRLRKGSRGQDLFDVLRSLGVENPKKQLQRFIADENKQALAKQNIPSSISLGPYTSSRTLGFLNKTKFTLVLDDETKNGGAAIASRKKNGTSTTLPVTLAPGDLYEVEMNWSSGDGRTYVAYDVEANGKAQ